MLNVGGWVGTVGNTGWYSITHNGGWYMTDTTYVRSYANKRVYNGNTEQYAFYTAGGMTAVKGFWHPSVNSNSYVLLAGGGYKAESSLSVSYATSAGSASSSGYIWGNHISNLNTPTTWSSDGTRLVYDTYSGSASNKPVSVDNANGLVTFFKSKHGVAN
jgi:hypothetical protein